MKTIGALVFPEFELLDMYGPLEMFGLLRDDVEIRMVAETREPVRSSPGPKTVVDDLISDRDDYDILIVPGGRGSRREVENDAVLDWLRVAASKADLVTSVCTGSAILAKAGLLNGRRATTNKAAYEWVRTQGPDVHWQPQARWVEDGNYFTSSGVSAGIDMSLAVISRLFGEEKAEAIAVSAEYEWHRDPDWDPFAKIHGLV